VVTFCSFGIGAGLAARPWVGLVVGIAGGLTFGLNRSAWPGSCSPGNGYYRRA